MKSSIMSTDSYSAMPAGTDNTGHPSRGPKAELVFGLVYPLGTEVGPVVEVLQDYLQHFGYEPTLVRISAYLKNLNLRLPTEPATEAERLINFGNLSCREAQRKDFLALAAV